MTRTTLASPVASATRVLALLCLLSGLFGPWTPVGVAAAQRTRGAATVDLAAMALTPADLQDIGFDDFRLDSGRFYLEDDVASMLTESIGMSGNEAYDTLDETGFSRWYDNSMYLPADEDDPLGDASRQVDSYIIEFGDDQGAAAMWDIIEDESGDDAAEDLRGVEDIGDQSEATHYQGDGYESIDLSFLQGNVYAGVRIVDWSGDAPELADTEALAETLLDHIETVLDEGGPGLSNQALRLTGDEVESSEDVYLLLDGNASQFYYEESRDARDREDLADETGMQNEYRIWQLLAPLEDEQEDDVWYYLMLADFRDEDAASEWFAGLEDQIRSDPQFTNFESEDNAPVFGDESLEYTVEWSDGGIFYRSIAIRLGASVFVIDLQAPQTPPADATEALGEAQLACLEDGECPEPLEIPAEVEAFISDLEDGGKISEEPRAIPGGEHRQIPGTGATETPEPEESPTAGATTDGVYQSALYGYTLTYDPDVWTLYPEDDPAADAEEWVTLQSEMSTVWIVGIPDYSAGEMGTCVETYLVDQDFDNSVYEAEPIEPLVVEDDRAYGTYTLEDQFLGTGNAYLSMECRLIAPDQTLVIMHFAMLDGTENAQGVPEGEVALFEDLMKGLVLEDGPGS